MKGRATDPEDMIRGSSSAPASVAMPPPVDMPTVYTDIARASFSRGK